MIGDCDFEVGRTYNVSSRVFADPIINGSTYCINSKGMLAASLLEGFGYAFVVTRVIKYGINWKHPFAKRPIREVLIRCVGKNLKDGGVMVDA